MREQHFHLLAPTTRLPISRCIHAMASDIACIFVDAARNFSGWCIRTALRFPAALLAIPLDRMVVNRTRFGNVGARVGKSPPLTTDPSP